MFLPSLTHRSDDHGSSRPLTRPLTRAQDRFLLVEPHCVAKRLRVEGVSARGQGEALEAVVSLGPDRDGVDHDA